MKVQVTITGTTHLVALRNGTIYNGELGLLLSNGQRLAVEDGEEHVLLSRRGPNQENKAKREADGKAGNLYKWYPVWRQSVGYGDHGCLYLREGTFHSTIAPTERPQRRRDPHVDPAEYSKGGLALEQTVYARNLLYHPGATLKKELGLAAAKLLSIIVSWPDNLVTALGGRLFGSEGQLRKPEEQLYRSERHSFEETAAKRLRGILHRVRQDGLGFDVKADALSRSVVIALMGDIGALYADTGATTGVENRTPQQAELVRTKIRESLKISQSSMSRAVRRVKASGGSDAVGPTKKFDRSRLNEKPERTGIHNTGREADAIIAQLVGIDGKSIKGTRWQLALISKRALSKVDASEPYAGHMSGSPAEILQIWDLLRGESPSRSYSTDASVRQDGRMRQRYARAAGASAFLVANGYHSSMEVLEGVLKYTGQCMLRAPDGGGGGGPVLNQAEDVSRLFYAGASTSIIGELHVFQTLTDKRVIRVDP